MERRAVAFIAAIIFALFCASGCKHEPPPAKPPEKAAVWSAPSKGPEHALVTIYEFSDFECPFCSKAEPVVDEVVKANKGKVRLVFEQFPLPFHKKAHLAAEAMLAAQDQGKGWEMHDVLFARPDMFEFEGFDGLAKLANDIVLDPERFNRALSEGTFRSKVDGDIAFGKSVGVYATPSFLVNGVLLVGAQPLDIFEAAIGDAVSRAAALMKKGVPIEGLDSEFIQQAKNAAEKKAASTKNSAPAKGDKDETDTEGE